MRYWN